MINDLKLIEKKTKTVYLISFLWGLGEGIFFFIVPDVFISFIALFSIKRGLTSFIFSILGSLISIGIIYLLTIYSGLNLNNFLLIIPGINQKMISIVIQEISTKGLINPLLIAFNGIPFKVFSVNAVLLNVSFLTFLLWSLQLRFYRLLPSFIIPAFIGLLFKKNIRSNYGKWLMAFILTWLFIYIYYFIIILAKFKA